MKRALAPLIALALLACSPSDEANTEDGDSGVTGDCPEASLFPVLTADPANSAYPDPVVQADCQGDELVVTSNGIPEYEFVPLTPNGLAAQDWEWTVTRSPEVAATPTDIPLLGTAAFAVNGLVIYGPNEGAFPDPFGDPVYNSIVDDCMGHTGGNADYHYHALLVACILRSVTVAEDEPDPVIGFALDGFPIYGPRGCVDAECSSIVTHQSSWSQTGDPTTYAWDAHTYVAQSGAEYLDRCNGHTGPDGDYHYHATEGFPYILGCYAGTPSDDAGAGDPGGGGGPGGDPPSCDEVPPGNPCCGDEVCDGPETAANCAEDCG